MTVDGVPLWLIAIYTAILALLVLASYGVGFLGSSAMSQNITGTPPRSISGEK